MKKLFTIMCATLLSIGVFAQAGTDAGTFLLSGATSFDWTSLGVTGTDPADAWDDDETQKNGAMNLKLDGGYCVADGMAIGLSVSYKSNSSSSEVSTAGATYSDESSSSSMVIAPSVRYYIGESGAWLMTSYGFGSMSYSSKFSSGGSSTTMESSNPMSVFSLGAGYAISLSDNISLNPSLGYSMVSVTTEDGYTSNSGTVSDLKTKSAGLVMAIGITLHMEN